MIRLFELKDISGGFNFVSAAVRLQIYAQPIGLPKFILPIVWNGSLGER
jgi:hypothetical protein